MIDDGSDDPTEGIEAVKSNSLYLGLRKSVSTYLRGNWLIEFITPLPGTKYSSGLDVALALRERIAGSVLIYNLLDHEMAPD